jgi:two-component system sensor histidine kinase ResE
VQTTGAVSLVRGTITNPDGEMWWYVGQAPNSAEPNAQRFLVAIKGPPLLTLPDLLNLYGADIFLPLLQAGVVGLIAAFIMSLILTRSVVRPLQDVAKAVSNVARGKVDERAPVRGPLEVRIVAEAFNEMAEQVAQTQQAQRDFLANVTHDLRTPLTSIQGFSQAIIDGVASNPEAAQRAAQIIHDESARLNRMVEELLDLARIEAGKLSMTRQGLQLADILNAVGERLTPRAKENGLTLTLEVPSSLPIIGGDGDRLAQVYTNLIDNAIKHTPEGGTVTMRAGQFNGGLLVQVCDTGEGIPADDLPHLFDRFYQVDKSRQRERREGAGLGLTITKQIVEAHAGRIWVESQEGSWTIFSTWYPVLAADSTTIIRRRPGPNKAAPATVAHKAG